MKKLFNPTIKRALIEAAKKAPKRGSRVVHVVKQALGWTSTSTKK